MPSPSQRDEQRRRALVEDEQRRTLPASGCRRGELGGQRRLAGSRRADDQRAGAFFEPAAEQRVQLRDVAGQPDAAGHLSMFGGDEAREDAQPAALDDVVVDSRREISCRDT